MSRNTPPAAVAAAPAHASAGIRLGKQSEHRGRETMAHAGGVARPGGTEPAVGVQVRGGERARARIAPRLGDRTRARRLAVLVPALLAAIVTDSLLAGAAGAPLAVPAGFAAGALLLLARAPMPLAAAAACAIALVL